SSTLATGQSFKQDLADLQTEHDALKTDTDVRIAALTSEKSFIEQSASTLRDEKNDLVNDKTRLTSERDTLRDTNNQLNADVSGIKNTLADYNTRNEKLITDNATLQSEKSAAEQAARDAGDERESALAAQRTAEQSLERSQRDASGLREEVAGLESSNGTLETNLASLAAYTNVSLSDITAQPLIDANVYDVHIDSAHDFTLVSLNVGENQKVKRGYTFEIWQGSTYKGQVRVESVQPDQCTAVVIRSVDGVSINTGDRAATRI
ncbi:MAG: hypothetical protein ACI841_004093, partial [Planctomycetota bacterium]